MNAEFNITAEEILNAIKLAFLVIVFTIVYSRGKFRYGRLFLNEKRRTEIVVLIATSWIERNLPNLELNLNDATFHTTNVGPHYQVSLAGRGRGGYHFIDLSVNIVTEKVSLERLWQ